MKDSAAADDDDYREKGISTSEATYVATACIKE